MTATELIAKADAIMSSKANLSAQECWEVIACSTLASAKISMPGPPAGTELEVDPEP